MSFVFQKTTCEALEVPQLIAVYTDFTRVLRLNLFGGFSINTCVFFVFFVENLFVLEYFVKIKSLCSFELDKRVTIAVFVYIVAVRCQKCSSLNEFNGT